MINTESVSDGLLQVQLMSKSLITIEEVVLMSGLMDPVSPGELLKEEFLEPMGLSQYRLAKETGIPAQRIGQIVLGRRRVTADTDLRLCRFFGLSDGYWLRAQAAYDLELARRSIGSDLDRITPWKGCRYSTLSEPHRACVRRRLACVSHGGFLSEHTP